MSRTTYTQWWQSLPIPWLVSGVNGQAEGNGWPAVVDAQTVLLDSARKQAFPDDCASDALPHLGGDRGLIQGPNETEANFRVRVKTAWDDWARAGEWVELLTQLYWYGFTGAYIAQQNGLIYSLSAAPTAGVDPTSLLTITNASTLGPALTSNVSPPTVSSAGRIIPTGNSWWKLDDDTDFCSRFNIYFLSLPLISVSYGRATFTGTEDGSVGNPWPLCTWTSPVTSFSYYAAQPGVPVITAGGPALVYADNTTKVATGIRIAASASFTGYVDVMAVGMDLTALAVLQSIIMRWRPARATCMGVSYVDTGKNFGWPIRTFGSGGLFGPGVVTSLLGRF